jgi:LL-diaminopimelate aminotransferase
MIAPAYRMSSVKPHLFAGLNVRKAQLRAAGIDVISLDMGSPDLPPHASIIEALVNSARNPRHHGYGPFSGTPAVKRAFAEFYARRFGVQLNPDKEVLLLIGSKEGIYHLSFAYLDPGDVALIPDPGYPTYAAAAQLAGATPHFISLNAAPGFNSTNGSTYGYTDAEAPSASLRTSLAGSLTSPRHPAKASTSDWTSDWLPELNTIPPRVLVKAKLLWLNYPNNPTTAIAPLSFFEQAVDFCRQHDVLLAHDNPYCENGYDGYRAPSVLQVKGAKDVAVEFFSLSKSHNMAGMRVGALVGNAEVVQTVAALKSNVDTGSFQAIQDAAVAALIGDQGWLRVREDEYRSRRDVCIAGLREAGCDAATPRATIYVWAKLPPRAQSSAAWAEEILTHTGVSITPGTAFGAGGEGYFRVSLTAPAARLDEAMSRIAAHEHAAAHSTTIDAAHAVLA